MCGFLLRIIVNAFVLVIVLEGIPGLFIDTLGGAMLGAAIIGLVNAAIRPLLVHIDSLSYTSGNLLVITLGVNILASYAIIHLLPGYQIASLTLVITATMLFTVFSVTLSKVIQDR